MNSREIFFENNFPESVIAEIISNLVELAEDGATATFCFLFCYLCIMQMDNGLRLISNGASGIVDTLRNNWITEQEHPEELTDENSGDVHTVEVIEPHTLEGEAETPINNPTSLFQSLHFVYGLFLSLSSSFSLDEFGQNMLGFAAMHAPLTDTDLANTVLVTTPFLTPFKRDHHHESTTFYQDLLARLGCLPEWIPVDFICPVTCQVIDDVPVYAGSSPARFNHLALLRALSYSPFHPLTRQPLHADNLILDLVLACRIKLFVEFIHANSTFLKSVALEQAKVVIDEFMQNVEKWFASLGKTPSTARLIDRTNQIIRAIHEQEAQRLCSGTLIVARKNPSVNVRFIAPTCFASNRFSFYRRTPSETRLLHSLSTEAEQMRDFVKAYGSCYALLGIEAHATAREIRRAYLAHSLRIHPDKNAKPDAGEIFNIMTQARKILLDLQLRRLHDESLATQQSLKRCGNFK